MAPNLAKSQIDLTTNMNSNALFEDTEIAEAANSSA